jgi:hypothetical protein
MNLQVQIAEMLRHQLPLRIPLRQSTHLVTLLWTRSNPQSLVQMKAVHPLVKMFRFLRAISSQRHH